MTRFEQLIKKSNRCLEAEISTTGRMAAIWAKHSRNLEQMAKRLSIEEATREVEEDEAENEI